jgi:hypothetical protein
MGRPTLIWINAARHNLNFRPLWNRVAELARYLSEQRIPLAVLSPGSWLRTVAISARWPGPPSACIAVYAEAVAFCCPAGFAGGALCQWRRKNFGNSATLAAILYAARRYIRLLNSSASKSDNTCSTSECV